jgi:TonB family protein
MKTALRIPLFLLAAWFATNVAHANTLMSVKAVCPLCAKEFVSSEAMECPACNFVWMGSISLTKDERELLRRFMASPEYRAIRSHPKEERMVLLSEQITLPPRNMTGLYLHAALCISEPDSNRRYLDRGLISARAWAKDAPIGHDEELAAFWVAHLLRRTGHFEEARSDLEALGARKTPIQSDIANGIGIELDLTELKYIGLSTEQPRVGRVSASAVASSQSTFDLPLNPTMQIISQPTGKYPVNMRYAGVEGAVKLAVVVEAHGSVKIARVLYNSQTEFESAAETFAHNCRFAPWLENGVARQFEAVIVVTYEFQEI